MGFKKHQNILSVIFIIFQFIYHVYCDEEIKGLWDLKQKGIIKTIKADNNEIIDCFDIYKQPAFKNPLIKDLMMEPDDHPFGIELNSNWNSNSTIEMLQDWHKHGECPEGSIPIRRNNISSNVYPKKSIANIPQQFNQSLQINNGHEYAIVTDKGGVYYGASGEFNIWNPKTEDNGFSLSQMWVLSSLDKNNFYNNLNSIEAGWTVYPQHFGDKQSRVFIYWTRDGYKNTGCYNLDCGGFVQINRKISLGMPLKSISKYGGQQFDASINIFKDKGGNWWLQLQGLIIGYWPASILTSLAKEANSIQWGGEMVNSGGNNRPATTQMGSGKFPTEGFKKSCFVKNLKVIDNGFITRYPGYLSKFVTKPKCYDLTLTKNKGTNFGTYIFFGGPGLSPTCQ